MAISPEERRRYRHAWRKLALDALDCARVCPSGSIHYDSVFRAARDWVCPTSDAGECAVCGALASMFVAFARCGRVSQRVDLAPGLMQWARLVLAILERAIAADAAPSDGQPIATPRPTYRSPYADV